MNSDSMDLKEDWPDANRRSSEPDWKLGMSGERRRTARESVRRAAGSERVLHLVQCRCYGDTRLGRGSGRRAGATRAPARGHGPEGRHEVTSSLPSETGTRNDKSRSLSSES